MMQQTELYILDKKTEIMDELHNSKLMGEDIDLDNIDMVIVSAYWLGVMSELNRPKGDIDAVSFNNQT